MSIQSESADDGTLQPKQQSLWRSSALMASGTMVSRLLGFVRSAMIIAAIGTMAGVADSFEVANMLPNMIYNLLAAGVLDAVLVPQIVKALRSRAGSPYVNKLITAVGSLLFLLTLVAMIATPILVTVFAPTFSPGMRSLTITFTLWCVPQIFFYGLYNLFGQILNARGVFGPYMWAPVVNNVVAILSLGIFLALWGVSGETLAVEGFSTTQTVVLCGSATLGVVLQALILIVPIRRSGVKLRPDFHLKGTSFGSVKSVAAWTFAALLVSQIGVISTTNIATRAGAWADETGITVAGFAAYQKAFMMFMLPQSLITVTIVTAIFTRLANHAAEKNLDAIANNFHRGVQLIVMLCMAAAAVLVTAATPLMQLLMPTLGLSTAAMLGAILVALALGLPSTGITMMGQRVFYALEDAKPVFLMGIIPIVIQVVVGWTIYFSSSAEWWTIGAAAAETVARIIQSFIVLFMVARVVPQVNLRRMFTIYGKYLLAFAVSALVGRGLVLLIGEGSADASGAAGRMWGAGWRAVLITLVVILTFMVALRFIDPGGFSTVLGTVLRKFGLDRRLGVIRGRTSTRETDPSAGDAELSDEAAGLAATLTAVPGSDGSENLLAAELDSQEGISEERGWSEDVPTWEQIFSDASTAEVLGRSASAHDPSATGSLPVLTDAMMSMAGRDLDPEGDLADWINATLHGDALDDEALHGDDSTVTDEEVTDSERSGTPPPPPPPGDAGGRPSSAGKGSPSNEGRGQTGDVTRGRVVTDSTTETIFGVGAGRLEGLYVSPEASKVTTSGPTRAPAPIPAIRRTVGQMSSAPQQGPRITEAQLAQIGQTDRKGKPRGRFDPTIPALLIGLVLVVGSLFFAMRTLFPGSEDLIAMSEEQSAQSSQSEVIVVEPDPEPVVLPVIAGTSVLSWSDDGGDHPELLTSLTDGDPTTIWRSRYFDAAHYPSGAPITLVLNLQEPALVTKVHISLIGSGGEVDVVDASEGDPRAGAVLGSAPLTNETTITLNEPTEVSSLGLIFKSLPYDDEGNYRAKVVSVTVE